MTAPPTTVAVTYVGPLAGGVDVKLSRATYFPHGEPVAVLPGDAARLAGHPEFSVEGVSSHASPAPAWAPGEVPPWDATPDHSDHEEHTP